MCDEAVIDSLAAWKFIPDWFITSKMIEKPFTALYANENIFYFDEDSGDSAFNYYYSAFLILILIIFVLMIILMKKILILLFLSDIWLDILNLKKAKNLNINMPSQMSDKNNRIRIFLKN